MRQIREIVVTTASPWLRTKTRDIYADGAFCPLRRKPSWVEARSQIEEPRMNIRETLKELTQ